MKGKRTIFILGIFLLALVPQRILGEEASGQDDVIQEVQFFQKLKTEDFERYQEIIQSKRSKIREKMKRLREQNSERFKKFLEKRKSLRKQRLQALKEKYPERFGRIRDRIGQRFENFAERHPERFNQWMEKHPSAKKRFAEYQRRRQKMKQGTTSAKLSEERQKKRLEKRKASLSDG